MGSALEGVRVIETATGIAGPVAGMLLGDFGAEVVKVEAPDGDPHRARPGFAVWNRGKRSVVADERALLDGADVWITDRPLPHPPHPALVTLVTSPYTDTTPWAGGEESDGLLAARMGTALRQGSFDGGPIDSVSPILCVVQGIWAAACATAALLERERSGHGQTVTVAGVHGAMVAAAGAYTFDPARLPERSRVGGPGGSVPFYRTYRCGDGEWLFLAALTPRFTERAFACLGVADILDDPRLEGGGRAAILRPEHARWVIQTIADAFATAPRDTWLERLHEAGCPVGPVLDRESWLDHPQVDAIGMRATVSDPERGTVVMPGIPINLTACPGMVRGPAPQLGEATPPRWDPKPSPDGHAPRRNGPLEGIRVLDLGAIIAGPFGASLLAELGADVIKVEPPTGDSFRGPGFAAYNKGQRGIALDLQRPEGRDAFFELVRTADVVVDNYRPGVLARLGLTWDELARVNDRIISVSVTGFGEGGPLSDEAGFDPVLQAMSGLMAAQGGDSDPVFFTIPVSDVAASACVALAATLALYHRSSTGTGQKTTTSLAATATLLQGAELVRFEGRPPPPLGGRDHPGPHPLDRFYRAADGWFRIHATHLPDAAERLARADITDLAAWAATLTRDEAVMRLTDTGIPAAPAPTVVELTEDEELLSYGVLHPDPRPRREGAWTAGRHARFSRTERDGTLVSPSLGEHTREVLHEAGFTEERVSELIDSGAAVEGDATRARGRA